ILHTGIEAIHSRENRLTQLFVEGIKEIEGLRLYGDFSGGNRLPVVSLNIEGLPASDLAGLLWEKYGIATRAGSHCAPLLHQRFKTVETGMVRFSFSYFNTEEEIATGSRALKTIAEEYG
ncbi:MAG: aminotransferase class V-fold PLP-dependent enzyme, partial [Desulfitobacterium hafniense]